MLINYSGKKLQAKLILNFKPDRIESNFSVESKNMLSVAFPKFRIKKLEDRLLQIEKEFNELLVS